MDAPRTAAVIFAAVLAALASPAREARCGPLHEAIREGLAGRVKRLVEEGADVNAPDEKGNLPLFLAAGSLGIAEALVAAGADVQRKGPKGADALHAAAAAGNTAVIELLLAQGADARSVDAAGLTALHHAALNGEESAVVLLLERGTRPDEGIWAPQGGAADGPVPLDPVKGCFKYEGGELRPAIDRGYTPLHLAAMHVRDAAGAERLPSAGVMVGARTKPAAMQAQNEPEYLKVVERLLNAGATVNARTRNGATPLHLAALCAAREEAEALIAAGADVNATTVAGETPLHFRARSQPRGPEGRDPITAALIHGGADAAARNARGETPLALARGLDRKQIAAVIVRNGNKAARKDACGDLHALASTDGEGELLGYCLLDGADANCKDAQGDTPLHVAVARGSERVAATLLDGGADANAPGSQGDTPLHRAVRLKLLKVVELLLARGGKADARNGAGQTPKDLAIEARSKEFLALLDPGATLPEVKGPRAAPLPLRGEEFHARADLDGSKVVIAYDLQRAGPVWLVASTDNGKSYTLPVLSVAGDAGEQVAPGEGKQLVWDYLLDYAGGIPGGVSVSDLVLDLVSDAEVVQLSKRFQEAELLYLDLDMAVEDADVEPTVTGGGSSGGGGTQRRRPGGGARDAAKRIESRYKAEKEFRRNPEVWRIEQRYGEKAWKERTVQEMNYGPDGRRYTTTRVIVNEKYDEKAAKKRDELLDAAREKMAKENMPGPTPVPAYDPSKQQTGMPKSWPTESMGRGSGSGEEQDLLPLPEDSLKELTRKAERAKAWRDQASETLRQRLARYGAK